MDAKKIAIPIILVGGLGVSLYLWKSVGGDGDDKELIGQVMDFTCPSCHATFQMTVAESRDMRRAKGDIFCKQCGAEGSIKKDVVVNFGGPSFEDENRPQAEPEEDPKPVTAGGMQPTGG